MSTRSTIFLKVNKEDFGREIICNPDKLPNPMVEFNYPMGKYKIHPNPIDDILYLSIYCHFDGYPSGVGQELLTKFKTYDDVLNLIALGDCSYIIDDICTYHNWRDEKLNITSHQGDFPDVSKYKFIDYIYVFEDGKWRHENK